MFRLINNFGINNNILSTCIGIGHNMNMNFTFFLMNIHQYFGHDGVEVHFVAGLQIFTNKISIKCKCELFFRGTIIAIQ